MSSYALLLLLISCISRGRNDYGKIRSQSISANIEEARKTKIDPTASHS